MSREEKKKRDPRLDPTASEVEDGKDFFKYFEQSLVRKYMIC